MMQSNNSQPQIQSRDQMGSRSNQYQQEEEKQSYKYKDKYARDNNTTNPGYSKFDDDFAAMMKIIDSESPEQYQQSSFLRMSSREYNMLMNSSDPNQSFSFSHKDQKKLEKKQKKKLMKQQQQYIDKNYQVKVMSQQNKSQQQQQQQQKREQGQQNMPKQMMETDNGMNSNPNRQTDIQQLKKQFTIDQDIIEEVYNQAGGDKDIAFDYLEELEERLVAQNDEDLMTVYGGSDGEDEEQMIDDDDYQIIRHQEIDPNSIYAGRKLTQKQQEQLDKDRKLAEDIQRQEKLRREQEIEAELMQELNMTEEQLTDMKIVEMLKEFLFKYRFDQQAEYNSSKRNIKEKDLTLKKASALNINEQHVFKNFILYLQTEQFNTLSKNAQIKMQLKEDHGYTEEELQKLNGSGSKNTPGNPQKQNLPQKASNFPSTQVKIDNKKEFPDLISESELQKQIRKQQLNSRMNNHNIRDMQARKKFQANSAIQEQMLYEIQDNFKALEHELIQEAYYAINDAGLLKELLKHTFPQLMTRRDTQQYEDLALERLFNYKQKREEAQNRQNQINQVPNARADGKGFFTDDILRRFKYMNMQRSKPQNDQQVYEQSRLESQKIYAQRKHYLNEIKIARKAGNHQQMAFAENQAEQFRIKYEQSLQMAQLNIFQMKNSPDTMNYYIDLHGIHLQEAITLLNRRLDQISVDLKKGTLEPNIGDGKNHVLKIVCGKGLHSKGRPVLKHKVGKGYEFYNFQIDGVVLVRLMA
eukprot:403362278